MPVATVEPQDPLKVWECKALKKNGSTEALALLQRIAKQVQPVMRKRNWRVPLLSEFSPKNPNLLGLNINGGGGRTSEIKIRLRPHATDSSFFPYEHLIGTMLHELVHNVQGPHNAVFYKLLDEITEECEGFMSKGISGSGVGFDAASVGRLGGRGPVPIHNPPSHQAKSLALKAAEARMKQQAVMPSGPRKLGGDVTLLKGLTPAQAAARAAERRARDNVWCPCDHGTDIQYNNDDDVIVVDPSHHPGQTPSTQQAQIANDQDCSSSKTQAARENLQSHAQQRQQHQQHQHKQQQQQQQLQQHEQKQQQLQQQEQILHASGVKSTAEQIFEDVVDVTDDPGPSPLHQPDTKRTRLDNHDDLSNRIFLAPTMYSEEPPQADERSMPVDEWECSTCTLLNKSSCLQCAACGQVRPFDFQSDSWVCKFCSVVNASALTHCAMCLRWKYSYGVPNLSRPTI